MSDIELMEKKDDELVSNVTDYESSSFEESQKKKKTKFVKVIDENGVEHLVPVKKKHVYTPGDIAFYIADYAFYIIFTIACLFPFYYLLISSISNPDAVAKGLVHFWPQVKSVADDGTVSYHLGITFQNFSGLISGASVLKAMLISVLRTILGTALMVIASAFVGYLMTKNEMWHKKFWYRFLVITMYFNAGLIPWYLNMSMLGLTNNFAAYIIPGIVAPYNIILVKTYIESIPGELEESAFMDGATHMTVFRKIIWPLSKPILATIAIFGAVGNWNSFQDSLILMDKSEGLWTLQHRLYIYLQGASDLESMAHDASAGNVLAAASDTNQRVLKYTISMVSIIPILAVYPFMQRYFEEGIMLGAVKG